MADSKPYTNRTSAMVISDMRSGDVLHIEQGGRHYAAKVIKVDGGFNICMSGSYYWADAWAAVPGTVAVPRCLALDPRAADTIQRGDHQEEVVFVNSEGLVTIDRSGAHRSYDMPAWIASAATWTSCKDREGGARFDPQVGDLVCTDVPGQDTQVACYVVSRSGDSVTLNTGRTASLETWRDAAAGLFPVRYACAQRTPSPPMEDPNQPTVTLRDPQPGDEDND